jgi:hypothetical protein
MRPPNTDQAVADVEKIIKGNESKGQPVTPEEALQVDAVLMKLSYRLRHAHSQTQEPTPKSPFQYSALYYLLGAIRDVREALAYIGDPEGMSERPHED